MNMEGAEDSDAEEERQGERGDVSSRVEEEEARTSLLNSVAHV